MLDKDSLVKIWTVAAPDDDHHRLVSKAYRSELETREFMEAASKVSKANARMALGREIGNDDFWIDFAKTLFHVMMREVTTVSEHAKISIIFTGNQCQHRSGPPASEFPESCHRVRFSTSRQRRTLDQKLSKSQFFCGAGHFKRCTVPPSYHLPQFTI